MERYGLRRGQRGAHRSESPNAGALTTVGQMLESTVPKRVPPPRPLRVFVASGVIVALVLFSYSTTQIYLRFAEPDHDVSAPGVFASRTPPDPTAPETPQPNASAQMEVTAEKEEAESEGVRADADGSAERSESTNGSTETQISYQAVPHSDENFMGTVTITNNGDGPIDDWELRLDFSDVRVFTAWEAEWETTSNGFVARSPSWAEGIAPGQSVAVSFTAQGRPQTPESCSVNGRSCGL